MTYVESVRLEFVSVLLAEWLDHQHVLHPTFVKNPSVRGYLAHGNGNIIVWRCLGGKVVGKTADFSKYLFNMCTSLNTLIFPVMSMFDERLIEKNRALQEASESKIFWDNAMYNGARVNVPKYYGICREINALMCEIERIHCILNSRNACRFVSVHYRKNDILIEFDCGK